MSKAKFASLLLGALLVTVPGVVLHAETATPQSVGLSSERLQRVHELVDRTIAAGEVSGAVTLVARNGQVAYLEAQGVMDLTTKKPMQPDTMFRLASMSKPATALYDQRAPGWNSSGVLSSCSVHFKPRSWRLVNAALPAELPIAPLMRPDVWVRRSSTVIWRVAGTV